MPSTPSDITRTLIIIYNADSTLRGKITYVIRKFKSSSDPACAACDITHGGLSLSEVPGWKQAKSEIEASGLRVVQWHRDEVEEDVKSWAKEKGIRYPVVLTGDGSTADGLKREINMVCDSAELAECAGDATVLVRKLKEKGLLNGKIEVNRSAL